MTTVSLSELLDARDASLRWERPAFVTRVAARLRGLDLRPVARALLVAVLAVFGFATRHGLVLAGCTVLVIGAATLSITAAWITAAASLFFLEARRR